MVGTWNGFEINFRIFIFFLHIPRSVYSMPKTSFAIYKPNGMFAPIITNLRIKQSLRRLIHKSVWELMRIDDERLAFGSWRKICDSEQLLQGNSVGGGFLWCVAFTLIQLREVSRAKITVFIITWDPPGESRTTSLFRDIMIRQRGVSTRWDRKT